MIGPNMRRTASRRTASGFTLVEVLIVIIIIGILASVTIPQFTDASEEAKVNTLAVMRKSIQREIDSRFSQTGEYPATLEASWFESQQLPKHSQNSFGVPTIEIEASAGKAHPTNKVLKAGVSGAFWYNPTEGILRVRVADMGSSAATLDAYNQVNLSAESALGNYSGDGGGGIS